MKFIEQLYALSQAAYNKQTEEIATYLRSRVIPDINAACQAAANQAKFVASYTFTNTFNDRIKNNIPYALTFLRNHYNEQGFIIEELSQSHIILNWSNL